MSINELLADRRESCHVALPLAEIFGRAQGLSYNRAGRHISSILAYSTCLLVFPPLFQSHVVTVGNMSNTTIQFVISNQRGFSLFCASPFDTANVEPSAATGCQADTSEQFQSSTLNFKTRYVSCVRLVCFKRHIPPSEQDSAL